MVGSQLPCSPSGEVGRCCFLDRFCRPRCLWRWHTRRSRKMNKATRGRHTMLPAFPGGFVAQGGESLRRRSKADVHRRLRSDQHFRTQNGRTSLSRHHGPMDARGGEQSQHRGDAGRNRENTRPRHHRSSASRRPSESGFDLINRVSPESRQAYRGHRKVDQGPKVAGCFRQRPQRAMMDSLI